MDKESAFGGSKNYQDFKSEGVAIAKSRDDKRLRQRLAELTSDDSVTVQRAAAVCYAASDNSPKLFAPYLKTLLKVLDKNVHPAGPRFTFRVLAELEIDEALQGAAIDQAFYFLAKASTPIAIKVFAMTVIANHLKLYPDLKMELEAFLRRDFAKASTGYQCRAKHIAKTHGLKLNENM